MKISRKAAKNAKRKDEFINLQPILEIVQAAIWTGRLNDEKPVSILLIADQESAKTEALKYFRGTSTLKYMSDLSSRGLLAYRPEIENKKIRHIVLLDLVRILSHGRNVSERTIQTIASLMEEGESDTSDAGGLQSWSKFPKIGVLMAVTPPFYKSKRGRWRQTGFLTRFLPVSFKYTTETVKEIHVAIKNGMKPPEPGPEALPESECMVQCKPKHADIIQRKAQELGEKMETYGFRYQRSLRALIKARARMNGRGITSDADLGKVLEWSDFFSEKEIEL